MRQRVGLDRVAFQEARHRRELVVAARNPLAYEPPDRLGENGLLAPRVVFDRLAEAGERQEAGAHERQDADRQEEERQATGER